MRLRIAWIQARPGKDRSRSVSELTRDYLGRLQRYIEAETVEAADEAALFTAIQRSAGRTAPVVVLLDARGKQWSSEEWAAFVRQQMEGGTQSLVFALGGADGWSAEARKRTPHLLSLGRHTLPHELARVVTLEQLYRAFTILKGHPYHTGH